MGATRAQRPRNWLIAPLDDSARQRVRLRTSLAEVGVRPSWTCFLRVGADVPSKCCCRALMRLPWDPDQGRFQ